MLHSTLAANGHHVHEPAGKHSIPLAYLWLRPRCGSSHSLRSRRVGACSWDFGDDILARRSTAGVGMALAGLAQLVEQLFRKQQVAGSSPAVGSGRRRRPVERTPKWRNRQTRYVQGVVSVRTWEFKSPLRHRAVSAYSGSPLPGLPNDSPSRGRARSQSRTRREGWSLARWARGKSELHRARVPGESRGGAFGRRQSRLARGSPRESNRDQIGPILRGDPT